MITQVIQKVMPVGFTVFNLSSLPNWNKNENVIFIALASQDMNIEARKLRIIEAFSSLKDIRKINQIESLIFPQPSLQDR